SSSTSAAFKAASWSSSMAPSTACSASLLHGAWRPANSRSGEETAGDADVIPGRLLPIGVPEQGGRMVRNDNRDAPKPVELVTERSQRLFRVEQRLRCGAAHGEDHLRLEHVDLVEQVGDTGRDHALLPHPGLAPAAL